MTDFDYDVMQKKRIASQAKYRKRGSKSKKCSLPSDGMTQKQWKEKCGPVETYKMNEPLTWDEFKTYPSHIQKEYVSNLQDTYGVSFGRIGNMMGVDKSRFSKLGLSSRFGRGYSMTDEQKEKWFLFVGSPEEEKNQHAVDHTETIFESQADYITLPARDVPTVMIDTDDTTSAVGAPDGLRQFSLDFNGKVNIDQVATAVKMLVGDVPSVSLHIDVVIS